MVAVAVFVPNHGCNRSPNRKPNRVLKVIVNCNGRYKCSRNRICYHRYRRRSRDRVCNRGRDPWP
eukprot:641573-Lingulodinium_polyedra.AAC.1